MFCWSKIPLETKKRFVQSTTKSEKLTRFISKLQVHEMKLKIILISMKILRLIQKMHCI